MAEEASPLLRAGEVPLSDQSFDEIEFTDMASHHGVFVSRDQHENILTSMGIITLD